MKYTLTKSIKTPFLYSKNNMITQVDKGLIDLSGYSEVELLGKSLSEISTMLRIDSQINLENIEDKHKCFIFNKELEPLEITISCKILKCKNEKIYFFNEKRDSRLKDIWDCAAGLSTDNKFSLALYSAEKLLLLKANDNYICNSYIEFNLDEIVLGKTLREVSKKCNINDFQNTLLSIIKTGKASFVNELKYTALGKEDTYWDVYIIPIFASGKVQYIIHSAHDVTERVVSRKLVESKNELLKTVIENMSDGVFICNKEGKSIIANTNLIERGKYKDLSELNNIFENHKYFDLYDNEIPYENIPILRALNGEKINNKTILIKSPSSITIAQVNALPLYDTNGNILGGAAFSNDITELYNKEKIIREQKEKLDVIIEKMSDGLIIINEKGLFITVNKIAREIFSISSEMKSLKDVHKEIGIYDSNMNLIDYESLPCFKIRKGENFSGQMLAVIQKNRVIHIEVNGTPIYDKKGNFVAGVLCLRDITENINLQELKLVKVQYDLLNNIIDNFALGYIRFSYPDFKIQYINAKGYDILMKINPNAGELSSIIGENSLEVYKYSLEDRAQLEINIQKLVDKKASACFLYRTIIMSGEERFFKLIYQPLFGLNNQITEIINTGIDITDEVKAKNDIEQTLKAQDEIFSNISHELKTPLNMIYSTSQLMEMYLKNDSIELNKDKINKNINIIKQNCYRFMKLINNIIDMSKINSGFFKANLYNENIVEVIEDTVQSVSEYISGKGIDIIFDTNTEEKIMACNPNSIKRIILNLISNAIKYTNREGSIFVKLIDKGENIEIYVEDTGIGIDEDHIHNIFERFYQADKSLSRNTEGVGIGLAIAKLLVETHGGKITAESQVGKGTVFKIELPVRITAEDEVAADIYKSVDYEVDMVNIEFSDIYSI